MAYVLLDGSNNVIGWFGCPQLPPQPDGYTIIDDNDPRIIAFNASQDAILNPVNFTFLQFIALFSPTEQAALVNSTDPQVKLFNLMAAGAGVIQLNNAEVIQGVNYVASVGIIANTRVTAILAGQAPS
jgi:hypothetical protein